MKITKRQIRILEDIRKNQIEGQINICPMCGMIPLNPILVFNKTSRVDNQTKICSTCGDSESDPTFMDNFTIEHWAHVDRALESE